ncbi:Inactive protein kinase SELMODRAFT_444075 [Linum perenne]
MMSNREQKRGIVEKGGSEMAEKVVVAVKASKEIPRTALVWALTHVVQPGDCITLLVVVPSQISGRKFWGFPRFAGDCASGHKKSQLGATSEQKSDITDSCSQMILQLHDVYDPNKINVKIKIVSGSPCGAVAGEAKKAKANWVVLDKHLKHEEKRCMEELQCNIVIMKRSQPKVLRLNLIGSAKDAEVSGPSLSKVDEASENHTKKDNGSPDSIPGPVVTPTSSPELGTPFTATEAGTSSVSSDPGTSPFFISESNADLKKEECLAVKETRELDDSGSETDCDQLSTTSASMRFEPWIGEFITSQAHSTRRMEKRSQLNAGRAQASRNQTSFNKVSNVNRQTGYGMSNYRADSDLGGEKADVYSFGVVLVELVTGRKAVDLNRPKGQQCLTEWARPLLEEYAVDELIDPRLGNRFSEQEVFCMLQAASLCIRRDPQSRPRMSQVNIETPHHHILTP